MKDSKISKIVSWRVFWGVLLALLTFSLVVLLLILITFEPVGELIKNSGGLLSNGSNQPMTNQEVNALARLVSIGAVLPAELVIAQISSFYTVIITFLVAIMAALSIVAYMYIKGRSEEVAKDSAEGASAHEAEVFFSSQAFADRVDSKISASLEASFPDFEQIAAISSENSKNISELSNKLRQCSEAVDALTAKLSQLDREESEGKDMQLIEAERELAEDGVGNVQKQNDSEIEGDE